MIYLERIKLFYFKKIQNRWTKHFNHRPANKIVPNLFVIVSVSSEWIIERLRVCSFKLWCCESGRNFPLNNYNTNMRESEHGGTSICSHTCLLIKRILKATIASFNNSIICYQIIYIFQSVIIHHLVGLVPPNVRRGFRLVVPGSVCCDPDLTRYSPINLSLSGSKLCLLIISDSTLSPHLSNYLIPAPNPFILLCIVGASFCSSRRFQDCKNRPERYGSDSRLIWTTRHCWSVNQVNGHNPLIPTNLTVYTWQEITSAIHFNC